MVINRFHQRMGNALFLLATLFMVTLSLSSTTQAATVTPGITLINDNDSIYLGDTVIIEIEAVGILDGVDITPLFKDADLLRETTGTRIAVVEERVVEVKLRRMEFLPRREGPVIFGPLQGETDRGQVSSNSLTIKVLPATNVPWQPSENDLQINVAISSGGTHRTSTDALLPHIAYIGQHIIVDIELRHQHPIAEEKIGLPDFDGFDVLKDYELRRTIDEVTSKTESGDQKNQRWRVIAWRYHLFAQRSGDLIIGPVTWSGLAIRSRTQRAHFNKLTDQRHVQIKPSLPDVSWWLPSTAVALDESWSSDARELSAGDEVIRTITLTAHNVLASHLPTVTMLESRAISSTLIEQTRTQQLLGDHIQAMATFRFRLVAQSPIPVFLDTVRVPWYDTSSSMLRESIIPARRINVGLPDRADLLAELALGEHWLDTAELKLISLANRFVYWHVSLVVLSAIACLLFLREAKISIINKHPARSGKGTSGLPDL
ncbi:MAG: hypothetical protein AB8B97_14155 [Granulosicoccus sp.]